jgi:hypothetical protein
VYNLDIVQNISNLLVSERQMLRKICGPFHCKEEWRIRGNNELQKLIKGEDVVKYIYTTTKNKMVGTC